MLRFVTILILITVSGVASGYATIDPDPDQLGVYFDTNADVNCLNAGTSIPFFVYVVLTMPTESEVTGFEFGYRAVVPPGLEGLVFRLATTEPCLNSPDSWGEGDYYCSFSSPLPMVGSNVVLVTWSFLFLAAGVPMDFFLGPASVESIPDGLPAYESHGEILPLGISSGSPEIPVATVNGFCGVISNEEVSFGKIKSMYR